MPRRLVLLALSVALAMAAALAIAPLLPKKYAASASFVAPSHEAASRDAVASLDVAARVAKTLRVDSYPEQLLRGLSVAAEGGSRVVKVVYTSTDPRFAAAAANEFVRAVLDKNAMMLDEARIPHAPVSPDPRLLIAIGAGAGLGLGLLLVFFTSGGGVVRTDRDLIQTLGVPLAWVRAPCSADAASRSAEDEALHSLASQLKERWLGDSRKALAVVSARPGEGRSYLAARLACVFAQQGEPTLLVDADLRAPSQHRIFKQPNRDGVADYLSGARIKPVQIRDNLWLMVAGEAQRNPLELLAKNELRVLLHEAAQRFSVVLIDTPSARKGPDLEMMLALARGALLVARAGEARLGELARLRPVLRRCSARLVGTVLTES
jgi:capsular exopolysaccharide synthesis family protein